jgi:hypothetical protein
MCPPTDFSCAQASDVSPANDKTRTNDGKKDLRAELLNDLQLFMNISVGIAPQGFCGRPLDEFAAVLIQNFVGERVFPSARCPALRHAEYLPWLQRESECSSARNAGKG